MRPVSLFLFLVVSGLKRINSLLPALLLLALGNLFMLDDFHLRMPRGPLFITTMPSSTDFWRSGPQYGWLRSAVLTMQLEPLH